MTDPATLWAPEQILCSDTSTLTRDEWLTLRRFGIGGSEAAAIAGVSPWSTPYKVWLDKTGVMHDSFDGNEATWWGQILEPIIAHRFAQEHPELTVESLPVMLRAKEYPWMVGNPDAILWDEDGRMGVLEVKCTGEWMAHEWDGDDLPLAAYFQALHYTVVTGAVFAWCAVLIGGNKFVCREVPMDPDIIAEVVNREERFWQMVRDGEVPRMMRGDTDHNAERFPADNGDEVELPSSGREWVRQYVEASAEVKDADARKGAAGNELRLMLGDAKVGTVDGERVVSWATTQRGGRTLRILKAGKGL